MNACQNESFENYEIITQAFYTSAGRRYGADNRKRMEYGKFNKQKSTPGRRNPVRNGEVMKCRGCDSEYHFIRDCPKLKKSALVGIIASTIENQNSISFNEIYDVAQELPDEVRTILLPKWALIPENLETIFQE